MQREGTPGGGASASEQPKEGSAKGSEMPQAIAGCLGSLVTQEFVCPPGAAWLKAPIASVRMWRRLQGAEAACGLLSSCS